MTSGSGGQAEAPAPFEAFLSAALGEEPNGMTLSVVSAFARLDLDPYREAARLAAMSRRDAATSLARLFARLQHTSADNALIASLIQLLPKPPTKVQQADARLHGPARLRRTQIGVIIVLAAAVLYLYATASPPPAQAWPPHSPAASEK